MNSTPPETTGNDNPVGSIVKAGLFFLGGLFCSWNLLVAYAFSTMVDPALPARERNREIVRRFLMGAGNLQTIFVIMLFAGAIFCFALCSVNLWSRVTGVPMRIKTSSMVRGVIVLALLVLGILYFAFA